MNREINLEKKIRRRSLLLGISKSIFTLLVFGKLFYLQILQKSKYGKLSDHNRIKVKILYPERGKIFDRNGNIMWGNTYGSLGNDVGFDVIESKSGTIIVGKTNSFGNGGNDGWVLGLNSLGKEQWSKAYGGEGFDEFSAICRLRDGNFVVTGTKASGMNGDDIWLNWMVKLKKK